MRGHDLPVIVPYTRLHPQVVGALAGWDVAFYDVSSSDDAYWQLLHSLWTAGRAFILVEHDIIVRPGALDELANCPNGWCSFQVPYVNKIYAGLSCVKFTAGLIARHPDAIDRIGSVEDDGHPPKHWCRLDSWLQAYVLNPGGEEMCVHGPPLQHVRDGTEPESPWTVGPAHGCWR